MHQKYLAITILVFVLCIMVLLHLEARGEGFVNKHEKALTIVNWFQRTANPTYESYKRSIPESNVVDYEDASALLHSRNLTTDKLENIL